MANGTDNGCGNNGTNNSSSDDNLRQQICLGLQQSNVMRNDMVVNAIIVSISTVIERLKMNSYLLSAVAEGDGNNNTDEERSTDNIDRFVDILVIRNKEKNNAYTLIDPNAKKKNTLISHLKRTVTEDRYDSVMRSVEDNSKGKLTASQHNFKVAVQYMKVWANFILWSCDFAQREMTLDEVNKLTRITEERLKPMFAEVKNCQGKELGIRNFTTTDNRYQGSVHDKLDQLMIEYRHEMGHNNQTFDVDRNLFIVFGVPDQKKMIRGEKCERVKRSKNASKNENLMVELPVYNEFYDPKSDPESVEVKIDWGGL